jgi:hypothetical protein
MTKNLAKNSSIWSQSSNGKTVEVVHLLTLQGSDTLRPSFFRKILRIDLTRARKLPAWPSFHPVTS